MDGINEGKNNQSPENEPVVNFFEEAPQSVSSEPEYIASQPTIIARVRDFMWNKKIWFALVLAFFVLFGGVVWGYTFYEHNYRSVALESILPANANVVAKITINPDGQQFKLLEANLEKFPGYKLLQKNSDKAGEGKTMSQVFQDKLAEQGLDFQNDIRPVIADQAYVVIPDASPLGKNIQDNVLLTLAQKNPTFLAGALGSKDGAVLGASNAKITPAPLDFIVGAPIINAQKAQEVIKKLQKDARYTITAKNANGYAYYEMELKDAGSAAGSYVNYATIYHAMLGGNWVFTSREDYMQQMIARRQSQQLSATLFSKNPGASLKNDADFQRVNSELADKKGESLIEVYYKLNFNDFFGQASCATGACTSVTEFIKYPENIIAGALVRAEADGIVVTTNANKLASADLQNVAAGKSLAFKIPQQVDQRWTDVFMEDNNLKNFYYSFKKNNLTDNGLKSLNDGLARAKEMSGINPETDFIDLISGGTAVALFSKKDLAPESALILEIADAEKMNATMHKLVDAIKNLQIGMYSAYTVGTSAYSGVTATYKPSPAVAAQIKQYQALLEKVKSSAIQETVLPEGKVYSYAIPPLPAGASFLPISNLTLNYSLEDGKFIFSTNLSVVQALLGGLKNSTPDALAAGAAYKTATRYYPDQMYSSSFVNPQGVFNAAEYIYRNIFGSLNTMGAKICEGAIGPKVAECAQQKESAAAEQKKQDDWLSALSSIVRTVKSTGAYNAITGNAIKSSMFWNIAEIPKEEKDRAENIIANWQ